MLKLEVTDKQRCAIESSAQKILDVRAKYPDATLADLYDELTMPADLRTVHKKMTAPSVSTENFCAVSRILQTPKFSRSRRYLPPTHRAHVGENILLKLGNAAEALVHGGLSVGAGRI